MSFFSGAKRKKVDDDNEESKKQTCSGMRATCAFIAWYNCSSWCSPRGMRMVCMRLSTVGVFVLFLEFLDSTKSTIHRYYLKFAVYQLLFVFIFV